MTEELGFVIQRRHRPACWSQRIGWPCGPLNPMSWG